MTINDAQFRLSLPIAMAAISFVAAPIVAYFSSQAATAQDINTVDTRTQVQQVRIDALENRFDKFETKLDAVLRANGVDPANVK